MLIFVVFVDVVVKVRFRLLARLPRWVGAGFHRPGGCSSGADTDPDELRVSALPFDLIWEVLGDSPLPPPSAHPDYSRPSSPAVQRGTGTVDQLALTRNPACHPD